MAAIITNNMRIFSAEQFMESLQENTTPWQPQMYAEGDSVRNFDNTYICVQPSPTPVYVDSGSAPSSLFGKDDRGPVHDSGTAEDNYGNKWVFTGKNIYNNLYMGIGKPDKWGTVDSVPSGSGGGNEYYPPSPKYASKTGFDALDNLISAKRIQRSDVALAIPRVDWEQGVIYTMYDDQMQFDHYNANVTTTNMYVVVNAVNEYRIFKCINNKKYDPATNSVKPVPSMIQPMDDKRDGLIELADGYVWKFMYALDINDKVTDDYIECFDVYNNPVLGPGGSESVYMKNYSVHLNSISKNYPIEWLTIDDTTQDQINASVTNVGAKFSSNTYSFTKADNNQVIIKLDTASTNYVMYFNQTMPFEQNGDMPVHFLGDIVKFTNLNDENFVYYVQLSQYLGKDPATGQFRYIITPVRGINYTGNTISLFDIDFTKISDSKVALYLNVIAPKVTVAGNGTDFIGYANVVSGKVIGTKIEYPGVGYSTIYSTKIEHQGPADISMPNVRAIAGPQGAHGSYCIEELYACFVIINAQFSMDEQGYFPTSGYSAQFRQVLLMTNLKDKNNGFFVDYPRIIGPKNPYYDENIAAINGINTTDQTFIDNHNNLHSISGKFARVLYVENRKVVSRSPEQIENIRVVLEF